MVPSKEIVSNFMKELLSFNNERTEAARAGIMEQGLLHRCQAKERTGPLPESWPGGAEHGGYVEMLSLSIGQTLLEDKGYGVQLGDLHRHHWAVKS